MKKKRLFREEVKDRHTSHWDLDMMSREELEAMMAGSEKKDASGTKSQISSTKTDSDT
jgi:hypothetical protein|tara:strand:+ start:803 stop:976 length:174 start_codon:yes stop_codon:yes gene_type:complete